LLAAGDPRVRRWPEATRSDGGEVISPALLNLEPTRALRHERLDPAPVRPLLDRLDQISIDDGMLHCVAAIEHHVKSLDVIHLATCSLLGCWAQAPPC